MGFINHFVPKYHIFLSFFLSPFSAIGFQLSAVRNKEGKNQIAAFEPP